MHTCIINAKIRLCNTVKAMAHCDAKCIEVFLILNSVNLSDTYSGFVHVSRDKMFVLFERDLAFIFYVQDHQSPP
jgi:hypothetical protein